MSTLLAFLGIDVAMRLLEACLLVNGKTHSRTFPNNAEGHCALLAWALHKAGDAVLRAGVEATANYHKELVRYFVENGHSCVVLNPRQVRDLASGMGISCKTDKADAGVIAEALQSPKVRSQAQRSKLHDDMRDISRQIQCLTDLCNDTMHRRGVPARCQAARDSDQALIDHCKKQIKELEQAWLKLLDQNERLKEKYEHQLTLNRIGPKTARVAISEFPEDSSNLTVKGMSRYSGVTPCLKDSGEKSGHAFIQGGNVHLRKAFYMPALSACYYDEDCKALHQRLVAKGCPHKVALTAVMHKLIRRSAAVHIRHTALKLEKT